MSSKIYHYALVTRIAVNYQMIQNFIKFYLDLLSYLDRKNNDLIIVIRKKVEGVGGPAYYPR